VPPPCPASISSRLARARDLHTYRSHDQRDLKHVSDYWRLRLGVEREGGGLVSCSRGNTKALIVPHSFFRDLQECKAYKFIGFIIILI